MSLFNSIISTVKDFTGHQDSYFKLLKKYDESLDEQLRLLEQVKYLHSKLQRLNKSAEKMTSQTTFSNEEIKTLIRLCHPDKHNNSKAAAYMTAKLLDLRK